MPDIASIEYILRANSGQLKRRLPYDEHDTAEKRRKAHGEKSSIAIATAGVLS